MRIDELRSNPDKNIKQDVLEILSQYRDREDAFVTFTKLNKVGINPRSSYNTPLGIYAYPVRELFLNYVRDAHHGSHLALNSVVPFAGDQPHLTILSCPPQPGFIDDFTKFSSGDLKDTLTKLIEIIAEYSHKHLGLSSEDSQKYANDMFTKWYRPTKWDFTLEGPNIPRSGTPMGILWFMTWKTASLMADERSRVVNLNPERGTMSNDHMPKIWNALLRKLGFVGFCDRHGEKIIHHNEPIQAVFLSTESLRIISSHNNTRRASPVYNQEKENIGRELYLTRGLGKEIKAWFFQHGLERPFTLPTDYDWAINAVAQVMDKLDNFNFLQLFHYLAQRWKTEQPQRYEYYLSKAESVYDINSPSSLFIAIEFSFSVIFAKFGTGVSTTRLHRRDIANAHEDANNAN